MVLKGKEVYINGKENVNMTADDIIRLSPEGKPYEISSTDTEEVMILGLEFDKMLFDTSMYDDTNAEQRFVKAQQQGVWNRLVSLPKLTHR